MGRRVRGILRRGRHARSDRALILRRRPLLTAATSLALGWALLSGGPAVSANGGTTAQPLLVVRETYAGELGLEQLTGVAYAAVDHELLVTGRTSPVSAPVVVGIDRLGDPVPRGHLVRALGGSDLAVDFSGRELLAAAGGQVVEARLGAGRVDLSRAGVQTIGGVDRGPDGTLFLLDSASGSVLQVPRWGPVGTVPRVPLQTEVALTDIAYDPSDGLLYAAEAHTGRILSFTTDGRPVATYQVPGARDIGAIEFAPSADSTDGAGTQSLYATDAAGAPGGRLLELSTTVALAATSVAVTSAVSEAAAVDAPASLVRTTETSAFTPPSPDSSGVTYLPDRDQLLISDGEVEEMPIYAGANLFRTAPAGSLVGTGDTTAHTFEPTGVAYNPANHHVLVSDDDENKVFDFAPGPDGQPGTGDDVVTSFDTGTAGNGDAEGVAYDSSTGDVYTIDGVNREVYQFRNGSPVGHFDVAVYGLGDPEGIDYDSVRDTLVLVDSKSKKIYEVARTGQLVGSYDISAAAPKKAAGITVAPGSDGSGNRNYYVAARGVDNDSNPNENDGKLFEFSVGTPPPVGNVAPLVAAGQDQRVDLGVAAQLDGTVKDDGLPDPPGAVATTWTKSSGPGTVTFGDAHGLSTTADFSAEGTYVLELTANDGEIERSDTVTVEVLGPGTANSLTVPVSQASDDAEERLSNGRMYLTGADLELAVDGSRAQAVGLRFADVGLPAGAVVSNAYVQFTVDEVTTGDANLTVQGQAADSPPTFTSTAGDVSSRPRTTAAVPWAPEPWSNKGSRGPDQRTPNLWSVVQEIVDRPGWSHGNSLVLVITGTGDRRAESFDGTADPVLHVDYSVGGTRQNRAPTVDAGLDQTITLPAAASLSGSIGDDGLPGPPPTLSASWQQLSGPGTVTFADPGSAVTTATFSTAGSYDLELTASDGELSTAERVTVQVLPEGTTEPVTLVVPLASGADDMEERLSTGKVTAGSGDLNLGNDAGRPLIAGMRFAGISLPPGAIIDSARVQFRVDEVGTAASSLSIAGQAADDAPPLQAVNNDLSLRPTTATSVSWTPAPWPTAKQAGPDQLTPNLSAVLQEIVSRPGWASGGSIVLLVRGDGERTAESFEGRIPPVLTIVYRPPA
jgi:uncharacterized protein YjiK